MEEKDLQKEFEAAAKPLMDFMRDNCHPHCVAIVRNTYAEMFEGEIVYKDENNCND